MQLVEEPGGRKCFTEMLLNLEMPVALPEGCVEGGSLWEENRRKGLICHKNDIICFLHSALLSSFSSVASTELEESIGR